MEKIKVNLLSPRGEVFRSCITLPCFKEGDTITYRDSKNRTLISARVASIEHDIVQHEHSTPHVLNVTVTNIIQKKYPFPA